MRIKHALVEPATLSNLADSEPQENAHQDALPHGLCHIVPHLVVQAVNLLHPLQIVLAARSIRQSPYAQVVHVAHQGPRVLELNILLFKQFVFESGLARVVLEAHRATHVRKR